MSGAIIPDPLTIPATCTVVPPTTALAAAPFGKVSVVVIVCAVSSQLALGVSKPMTLATPARALSLGNGTPITPVEQTNTSLGSHARCAAT